ncbi:esterase [Rhodococcus wratislaviensis IFP 2016]|uniref:SGNH/GDSL hydrolase family protein n=1 Tax=Rhodococcus opacus TaxID=37919 RepID=A0AAX3Y891_RHOOP|nr:SGNH/GDSL hydrolase family protein [Rhodococcus opacus]ELB85769.1 esterase [Rhodococcus wratislaviensis IFP 2016]MCZ4588433.1 SGNH/GDSL hydrolase family protein [Rhodococcus opacus]UZG53517.1 SGNH/GDSL hydrolase family protein [Rhodococcus opacus]WLF45311.1 SGNH/GDSL hydrolase family protein [Rhodococcus opacus]CAG7581267.1 Lipase 2 [Rhodococcus opacus]
MIPATATAEDAPRRGPTYVALGDSRAAGPLIEFSEHRDLCLRSPDLNYPAKLARLIGAATVVDVTCSAAKPAHVISTPQFVGTGFAPPQIDALRPDTDVVTLSIGGGGSNHLPVSVRCGAVVPGADAGCRNNPRAEQLTVEGIAQMAPQVDAVVAAILAKAPNAEVYLIGHGGSVGRRGCWPNLPVSDADAVWLEQYFARFNQIYAQAAARYGVHYVDIATAAVDGGHDACAPAGQRWFEGILPQSPAEPAHPNALAMTAIAEMIAEDLGR